MHYTGAVENEFQGGRSVCSQIVLRALERVTAHSHVINGPASTGFPSACATFANHANGFPEGLQRNIGSPMAFSGFPRKLA